MDLRAIKKEVRELEDIDKTLKQFQSHWVKPIRSTTNSHLPFLKNISDDAKKSINGKIGQARQHMETIREGQAIHHKLHSYSRALVDLKLTQLRGDHKKSKMITNSLLNDEFLKMKTTISQINAFSKSVDKLSEHYEDINQLLAKELSLDETVFYMDLPHKLYLYNLIKTAQKQKKIIRKLAREFVSMTKKSPLRKK